MGEEHSSPLTPPHDDCEAGSAPPPHGSETQLQINQLIKVLSWFSCLRCLVLPEILFLPNMLLVLRSLSQDPLLGKQTPDNLPDSPNASDFFPFLRHTALYCTFLHCIYRILPHLREFQDLSPLLKYYLFERRIPGEGVASSGPHMASRHFPQSIRALNKRVSEW